MKKRVLAAMLSVMMVAGLVAGCGSSNKDEGKKGGDGEPFRILSIWAEDVSQGKMINDLTERYKEENPDFEYEIELVSANDLTTKIATLLASDDLPDAFAYVAGQPLTELIEADKVVNITEALTELGCEDMLTEGAANLLSGLSGTEDVYDLPLGLNMEGIWYNKALFEQAGVEAPATWDEFLGVCDTLIANGIQPIAVGGADKWPISRWINAYSMRSMGVGAVDQACAGEKSFMDEGFVESAQMVADMADKGYFGEGATTVDFTTAGQMVLAGEAAMCYNGSYFTQDILADTNPAGAEGIGFFTIPVVDESVSNATEIPMNCGNPLVLSKDKYDEDAQGWLKYFVEHAGDYGVLEQGQIKGYTYTAELEDIDPLNQMVNEVIESCTNPGTWWEAMMNNETKTAAQDNAQTLINGDMTAKEYMQSIQDAYDSSTK